MYFSLLLGEPHLQFLILIIFLVMEIVVFLKLNKIYCLNPPNFPKEGAGEGIKNYTVKTLSWIAILIGIIVLVEIETFKGNIFLLTSLVMFILSSRIEILSGRKRIFYFIQQRFFNYAILFLFVGFLYFVSDKSLTIKLISYVTGIILVLLHIYEFIGDDKIAKNIQK